MNKEELISMLGAPMQFQMVANSVRILESNDVDLPDLFEISFHKRKEIAFRAAWMLEFLMSNKPNEFVLHVKLLIELIPQQQNQSAMRHYSKMLALLTDKKADPIYLQAREHIDFEPVIEVMFSWLIAEQVLVATKVHCMQTLANLSARYNWIKEELLETINYLEEIESVAFYARAKAIKKTLHKH